MFHEPLDVVRHVAGTDGVEVVENEVERLGSLDERVSECAERPGARSRNGEPGELGPSSRDGREDIDPERPAIRVLAGERQVGDRLRVRCRRDPGVEQDGLPGARGRGDQREWPFGPPLD